MSTVAERQQHHADLVALAIRTGVCTETTCFQPASGLALKCREHLDAPKTFKCIQCKVLDADLDSPSHKTLCGPCRVDYNQKLNRKASLPTRTFPPQASLCAGCGKQPRSANTQYCSGCRANTATAVQSAVARNPVGRRAAPKQASEVTSWDIDSGLAYYEKGADGVMRLRRRERTLSEKKARAEKLGMMTK